MLVTNWPATIAVLACAAIVIIAVVVGMIQDLID